MEELTQAAIEAALLSDWEKAISLNQAILAEEKDNLEAMNRLAYAFLQTGKLEEAKKLYRKILSFDPYNLIAQKNLEKIHSLRQKKLSPSSPKKISLSPKLFLEEPGKTKTVALTNLAPGEVLAKLHIGEIAYFHPKKHSIEVRDSEKRYLGALPDDVAFRLLRFLKAGHHYFVCIKNVQKNFLSVFIKETKKGKKTLGQPSFLSAKTAENYPLSLPKEAKKTLEEETSEENQEEESEE